MGDPERVRRYATASPEATEALAEALGERLPAGAVVALAGELGAGKTTFVRGLARGLGVLDPVTSPTFALMHEAEGRLPLFHLDAWRVREARAFVEGGGAECLGGDGVAAVEWAENVEPWLPSPRLAVRLVHRGPQARELELRLVGAAGAGGPAAAALETALAAALAALDRRVGSWSPGSPRAGGATPDGAEAPGGSR